MMLCRGMNDALSVNFCKTSAPSFIFYLIFLQTGGGKRETKRERAGARQGRARKFLSTIHVI